VAFAQCAEILAADGAMGVEKTVAHVHGPCAAGEQ
jgi:hypothetical protein